MQQKPKQITNLDWNLLKEKYPNNLDEIISKIKDNYPVQYLIGDVDFYGNYIKVDERALIPRFETERLVEETIYYIKKYNISNPKIIDLATGSGCIAITLKKEIPSSIIYAIDNSSDALNLAVENSKYNKVDIKMEKKDILTDTFNGKYDVIISNPPYVSINDPVDKSIKYEPQDAIYASEDGLIFYKRIAFIASNIVNKKGIIALEIGYNQGLKVKKIFNNFFPNDIILIKKDYNNFDRYIFVLHNCE